MQYYFSPCRLDYGLFSQGLIKYTINFKIKNTTANRSVYVIGFPHRENFLAKEER